MKNIGNLITNQKTPLNLSEISNVKFEKFAVSETFVTGISSQ